METFFSFSLLFFFCPVKFLALFLKITANEIVEINSNPSCCSNFESNHLPLANTNSLHFVPVEDDISSSSKRDKQPQKLLPVDKKLVAYLQQTTQHQPSEPESHFTLSGQIENNYC